MCPFAIFIEAMFKSSVENCKVFLGHLCESHTNMNGLDSDPVLSVWSFYSHFKDGAYMRKIGKDPIYNHHLHSACLIIFLLLKSSHIITKCNPPVWNLLLQDQNTCFGFPLYRRKLKIHKTLNTH